MKSALVDGFTAVKGGTIVLHETFYSFCFGNVDKSGYRQRERSGARFSGVVDLPRRLVW